MPNPGPTSLRTRAAIIVLIAAACAASSAGRARADVPSNGGATPPSTATLISNAASSGGAAVAAPPPTAATRHAPAKPKPHTEPATAPTPPQPPPSTGEPANPTVPGDQAQLAGAYASAPAAAPPAVKQMIWSGNDLQHKPYIYAGGHATWVDRGYDCSGTVSYVLHAAGLLDGALDSTGLMSWGGPGAGSWVTIYANPVHTWIVIAGLRLDTARYSTGAPSRSSAGRAGAWAHGRPAASACATRWVCRRRGPTATARPFANPRHRPGRGRT